MFRATENAKASKYFFFIVLRWNISTYYFLRPLKEISTNAEMWNNGSLLLQVLVNYFEPEYDRVESSKCFKTNSLFGLPRCIVT